ncbi:hypothetical protein [Actinomadura opuntiae]|uniref:hypothetical protein n=1 Tax=Actinomadura sp. OS1-43 TaxID=604315 RepID=UPI00255A939A|nr:hypothetical protein [Actinomadura sp. OS1-43]MDL4821963.1 hypothetical protein [Actinomadura sp. OS1-43]
MTARTRRPHPANRTARDPSPGDAPGPQARPPRPAAPNPENQTAQHPPNTDRLTKPSDGDASGSSAATQPAAGRRDRPAEAKPGREGAGAGGKAGLGDGGGGLAERVAEVVRGCRFVAGLTAGPWARIVTYRAGRPFAGVVVRDGEIEIGVVARTGRPFTRTAEDVRRAVRPLAGERPVHVLIGDIAEGGAK